MFFEDLFLSEQPLGQVKPRTERRDKASEMVTIRIRR